jgi:hypothetical protein
VQVKKAGELPDKLHKSFEQTRVKNLDADTMYEVQVATITSDGPTAFS